MSQVLYMGKRQREKTFVVFTVFHSTANLFPQTIALSISNISLQQCYSKGVTVNSLPTQNTKVSPTDVFPYMVCQQQLYIVPNEICVFGLHVLVHIHNLYYRYYHHYLYIHTTLSQVHLIYSSSTVSVP